MNFLHLALTFRVCLHKHMPFFGNLSTAEWVIIGIVVILFFGTKKLKDLGRGLGESGKELKRVKKEFSAAVEETKKDITLDDDAEEKPKEEKTKKASK
jgi:sec-independent protein translocase protein TatA